MDKAGGSKRMSRTGSGRIDAWLEAREGQDLLRVLACGGVDDGKSTLIGRLLHDSGLVLDDERSRLAADSARYGTLGDELDLALLVDGLEAEREQGITIDVAYRHLATARRGFIVADAPGHEQYTRNMATGASTAELAVILVDARKGVLPQTRRHAIVVDLLGIRHVVLALNKMDLVGFSRAVHGRISRAFGAFAARLGFVRVTSIPVSALTGANVLRRSEEMPWYRGPTLMEALETSEMAADLAGKPFRMPVQWVNRPNPEFRGFAGTIAAGTVRPGDEVLVCPSRRPSRVGRIVTMDGDLAAARAGQAVTLTLADEVDAGRGAVIASAASPPEHSDQFCCHLIWMHEDALLPERQYRLQLATQTASAQVTDLRYRIHVDSLERVAARTLELNEIASCNIALDRPLAFDPYGVPREMGSFILIDRLSNATVGAGMIAFGLRRAANLRRHALAIDKRTRAAQKDQKPCVLWFTGLSGAGKSQTANAVERRLLARGRHSYVLDGDNLRHGLTRDLGFTAADRVENVRRIAETARLFVDAGLIVLVAAISPFRDERRMARELMAEGEFVEIFVDAPLEVCEARDPKGLYRKARAGELRNFTGIDSDYEPPEAPDIVLDSAARDVETLADQVIDYLERGM